MEDKLWDILPKYYEYKVITFEQDEYVNFDATFRVNLFNEIAVKNWLKQFEQCSLTNFRVARTAPAKQSRVLFKKYYRCHHNTRAGETASKTKKAHVKHTGCEATLLITVNNAHMKSCKQPDLKRFPCTVKYHNYHNHPLSSDELLCHRKPSERIEQKIRELLLKNHTPVSALKILKQDLQQEFKDEYSKIIKDGAFCPKLQWVYHKYYSIFKDMCTDPYKLKYFPSEFMIEECEDEDSDTESSTEVVKVEQSRPSSPENSYLASNDEKDVAYEEYVLPSEDKSLFENHFVEVYTIGDSEMINGDDDIFISENDIADLPIIREVISVLDNEAPTDDHDNEEIIVDFIEDDPTEEKSSSTLWDSKDIKQKNTELNEEDLNDIFGETCSNLKINADIFLPSIKDEINTYKEDET